MLCCKYGHVSRDVRPCVPLTACSSQYSCFERAGRGGGHFHGSLCERTGEFAQNKAGKCCGAVSHVRIHRRVCHTGGGSGLQMEIGPCPPAEEVCPYKGCPENQAKLCDGQGWCNQGACRCAVDRSGAACTLPLCDTDADCPSDLTCSETHECLGEAELPQSSSPLDFDAVRSPAPSCAAHLASPGPSVGVTAPFVPGAGVALSAGRAYRACMCIWGMPPHSTRVIQQGVLVRPARAAHAVRCPPVLCAQPSE